MSPTTTALWWARARSRGPVRQPAGTPAPEGFLRLLESHAGAVWLLPEVPEGAGPAAVGELGLSGPVVEQPNDTARVLAVAVRCCWTDPDGPLWPGRAAPFAAVTAVFRGFAGRDEESVHRSCLAAVRRLHSSGWLLWDERARTLRLGPRTATWSQADLTVLRELCRRLPAPPPELLATAPEPAGPAAGAGEGDGDDADEVRADDALAGGDPGGVR
ncbi:MAG TPA: hypothetical protein VFP72_17540 [Kineosporiaceae bacterium]|nr:hypothetical protein [Kineosporiaceae bacterium]